MIIKILSRKGIVLGSTALVGLALLVLGWQGGLNNLNDIPAVAQAPAQVQQEKEQPSGHSVQVKQGGQALDGSSFFVDYRMERERSRGQQIALLREIIDNPNSGGETRKKAQEQMLGLSQGLEKEVEVENLIRAKGYQDAVLFLEGKAVTVVVQAKSLNQEDALRIADLVSRNTNVGPQNIVIVPKP